MATMMVCRASSSGAHRRLLIEGLAVGLVVRAFCGRLRCLDGLFA